MLPFIAGQLDATPAVINANGRNRQTVAKRVDGLRDAIEKAEKERDAAAADAYSSKTQLQALQAQVTALFSCMACVVSVSCIECP